MKATTAGYFLGLGLLIAVPVAKVDIPATTAAFQDRANPVSTANLAEAFAAIAAGGALMWGSASKAQKESPASFTPQ